MSADFEMAMGPDPGDVATLLGAFARFADASALPNDVRRTLMVVLDELLANLATHALAGRAEGKATVHAVRSPDALRLTVTDNGPPFDPLARESPDTALSIADRPIGGLGIHLVQRLLDEVRYERRGDSNVLMLTKRIPDLGDADNSPGAS